MEKRVALYARYSTDKQEATSIDDQFRKLRECCGKHGWTVVKVYQDEARSSQSLHNRTGIQALLADMERKSFDMVIVEKMDRLSRKVGDSGAIFERMKFHGVEIFTLVDGYIDVTKLCIGALLGEKALEEIKIRTHRGLEGRVLRGKSAGGKSYGYRPVRDWDANGKPVTGELEIVPEQADTVRRIMSCYVDGLSPPKIAAMLNRESVPGPRGGKWDKSSIHGNPNRGSGILNNELYIGIRVWNRGHSRLNPATGNRVSRRNEEEVIKREPVPHLRIVDQDLWDRVQARRQQLALSETDKKAWQARDKRFLLTGLVRCGCCGGNYAGQGRGRMGCATSLGKGKTVCSNRTGIDANLVERMVLSALAECFMEEFLVRSFAEEYLEERKRLAATSPDLRMKLEQGRMRNMGEQDNLVNALGKGLPADRIKVRLEALTEELAEIEARLAALDDAERESAFHLEMAADWRAQIRRLIFDLSQPGSTGPTMDAIRALISQVVVSPVDVGKKRPLPHVLLKGDICGVLALSLGVEGMSGQQKTSTWVEVLESRVFLVAGAGFEHCLTRLQAV